MKLSAMQKLALSTLASNFGEVGSNKDLAIQILDGNQVMHHHMEESCVYVVSERINKLNKGKLNLPTWSLEPGSVLIRPSEETLAKLSWWHSNYKGEEEVIFFVILGFHENNKNIVTHEHFFVSLERKDVGKYFTPCATLFVGDERLIPYTPFDIKELGYVE